MRRAAAKPDGPNRVQKRKPGLVAFKCLILNETDTEGAVSAPNFRTNINES
jgi:hypothetical protein